MAPGGRGRGTRPLPELADELARRKNARPIRSADDLACEGIFDTDEELNEFLEDTYAARRANLT